MKKLFLAVIAFAVILPAAASAQTKRGPQNAPHDLWCRDQPIAQGSTATFCSAYTFEQCMASRASHTERCYLNPRYDPRFRRG